MNQLIENLNNLIRAKQPQFTEAFQNAIREEGLDPVRNVAHGSPTVGRVDMGICTATIKANYSLTNMTGYSSAVIEMMEVTNAGNDPENASTINGNFEVHVTVQAPLKASLGGNVEASCGFLHQSIDLSGSTMLGGVSLYGNGTLTASQNGTQLCLERIQINGFSVNYGSADADIGSLGILESCKPSLENAVLDAMRNTVRSEGGNLGNAFTQGISRELPACDDT